MSRRKKPTKQTSKRKRIGSDEEYVDEDISGDLQIRMKPGTPNNPGPGKPSEVLRHQFTHQEKKLLEVAIQRYGTNFSAIVKETRRIEGISEKSIRRFKIKRQE